MVAPRTVLHLRHAAGGGGGADAVLLQDLSRMDKTRYRPVVAYLRKRGETPAVAIQQLRSLGIPCHDLPGAAVLDIAQVAGLARLARETDAAIVHCHDPKADIFGYLVGLLCPRMKLVCTLHGWTVKVRREAVYNWLDIQAVKRFDAVLAVSESLRGKALAAGLKRVRLVPNAIDGTFWTGSAGERPSGCAVGFIGRLSPEKGAMDFVRTARRVADEKAECEFVVAGEGPQREAMAALAADLGLGGRVRFLGLLDSGQLREVYRSLSVVLLTSHTEGLPMVVLEALSMGIPVVATRVGGVGEVIADGRHGLLAEAGDVDGLARHVLRLMNDEALRRSFAAAGRKFVEKRYALQARIAAIEEVYQQLFTGR